MCHGIGYGRRVCVMGLGMEDEYVAWVKVMPDEYVAWVRVMQDEYVACVWVMQDEYVAWVWVLKMSNWHGFGSERCMAWVFYVGYSYCMWYSYCMSIVNGFVARV